MSPWSLLIEDEPLPLPLPPVRRWTARRKAAVVNAIRTGMLRRSEACARYDDLSLEEVYSWERLVSQDGLNALRSTRLMIYRESKRLRRQRWRRGGLTDVAAARPPVPPAAD